MDAQQALRRTMEKYVKTCRLILICTSISRVLSPLRSRCVPIKVPAPSFQAITSTLNDIVKKEKLSVSDELINDVALKSQRNLRKAILMLEGCVVQQVKDNKGIVPDYEKFIDDLAGYIISEQSPGALIKVRGKLFELLKNCIPPSLIMTKLVECLLKRVDDEVKHEIITWAAHYEHSMQQGSKPIFHLEAFVARFMSIFKRWLIARFG